MNIATGTMQSAVEIQEIMSILPHRSPMLMIDRVVSLTPDKSIVAIRNVTSNDPLLQGHFPGNPVLPGVMFMEAIAQAGGILVYKSYEKYRNLFGVLSGMDGVRLKNLATPGDQLCIYVQLEKIKLSTVILSGYIHADKKLIMLAEKVFLNLIKK